MNNWLTEFFEKKPEYRKLPIVRRSRSSVHFELEPGLYEAHFWIDPRFERARNGLWIPKSQFTDAVKLAQRLIRSPRALAGFALALPFMTTLTLQPDAAAGKDTYLRQLQPTRNYGIASELFCGKFTGTSISRTLIQPDVSSIPSNVIVQSGVWTLVCVVEADTSDVAIGAHRGLTQWFEGAKNNAVPDAGQDGSTWDLRNANGAVAWGAVGGQSGTDYSATATGSQTVTGTGAFSWTVTADVAAWVAGTATNYGNWFINTAEGTSNSNKQFDPSDSTTAANRPKLVVVYTLPVGMRGIITGGVIGSHRGILTGGRL